jgi:hypothetical protein
MHQVMAGIYGSSLGHKVMPGRILMAAVESEQHALGLRPGPFGPSPAVSFLQVGKIIELGQWCHTLLLIWVGAGVNGHGGLAVAQICHQVGHTGRDIDEVTRAGLDSLLEFLSEPEHHLTLGYVGGCLMLGMEVRVGTPPRWQAGDVEAEPAGAGCLG